MFVAVFVAVYFARMEQPKVLAKEF
jgi:hypothetical protein